MKVSEKIALKIKINPYLTVTNNVPLKRQFNE